MSLRAIKLVAILLTVGAATASACINTLRSDLYMYKSQSDAERVKEVVAKLEEEYREDPTLETTNDLAVGRVFAGRYDDAIALLREAETKFPGNAVVAANMGTAFELAGNDDEALRWISEGVRRDPKEHVGSEWLHVRILEAKIALAKDPDWLRTHTVLGVKFGTDPVPVRSGELPKDERGVSRTVRDVVRAIDYQLGERTTFVKPPDAVVADLYAAGGDLIWANGKARTLDDHLGYPEFYYESALEYSANAAQSLVETRMASFKTMFPNSSWVPPPSPQVASKQGGTNPGRGQLWLIVGVVVMLAVGAAFLLRPRKP